MNTREREAVVCFIYGTVSRVASRTGQRKTNPDRWGTSNPGITARSLSKRETCSAHHGQLEYTLDLFIV